MYTYAYIYICMYTHACMDTGMNSQVSATLEQKPRSRVFQGFCYGGFIGASFDYKLCSCTRTCSCFRKNMVFLSYVFAVSLRKTNVSCNCCKHWHVDVNNIGCWLCDLVCKHTFGFPVSPECLLSVS